MTPVKSKLNALLDLRLENKLTTEEFEAKKKDLTQEVKKLEGNKANNGPIKDHLFQYLIELGKLFKSPLLSYKKASVQNRRRLIQIFSENLILKQSNPLKLGVVWRSPFDSLANRQGVLLCGAFWLKSELFLEKIRTANSEIQSLGRAKRKGVGGKEFLPALAFPPPPNFVPTKLARRIISY